MLQRMVIVLVPASFLVACGLGMSGLAEGKLDDAGEADGPAGGDADRGAARDASGGGDAEASLECNPGATRCSDGGVETCTDAGQWGDVAACPGQTCIDGGCQGACAPGQTRTTACGNCGTEPDTCTAGGTWTAGVCAGEGVCAPGATRPCNTYGTETCTAGCAWGDCTCPSSPSPVCTPGDKQCDGDQPQACSACGQWGDTGSACTGIFVCIGGGCVVACANWCTGCCTPSTNTCHWSGSSDDACGSGGAPCQDCAAMGQHCQQQQCQGP